MDKAFVLVLFILSISQLSTGSFRVLLEDEVPEKVNSPAENVTSKDKLVNKSLATSNPSNQSEQATPGSVELTKNETLEPAPPARTEENPNPKQENATALAPPVNQESKKSTNSSEGGGVVTDSTGAKTDTGTKKDENVGKIKDLCDAVASSDKCTNDDNWIACLQRPSKDSKELFLIVENKGENDISIDIKSTPTLVLDSKKLDLAKQDYSKVKILISNSNEAADVTVNAGKKDCTLHVKLAPATTLPPPTKTLPVPATTSDWQKSFQQFASYATQLTPIYGAYLLLFTSIIISLITWACCKFVRGRRRSNSGLTYQQLEMGGIDFQSNSANADVVNTADGWENGWDDNWDDEEAAVDRPAATNGVSANSLSSSRSNDNINSKDGWDYDWDD